MLEVRKALRARRQRSLLGESVALGHEGGGEVWVGSRGVLCPWECGPGIEGMRAQRDERGEEPHGSPSAAGAEGEVGAGEVEEEFARGLARGQRGRWGEPQELAASGEVGGLGAAGQEAEVADARKCLGHDVEEEASDELGGVQGEGLLGSLVLSVPVREGDGAVADVGDAVVGDGDPMGVASEVVEDVGGSWERGLRVDDPGRVPQGPEELSEAFGGPVPGRLPGELEGAGRERLVEIGDKLAAEDRGEGLDRKEGSSD